MSTSEQSETLTAKEAAALLKVSRSTFQRFIKNGKVKPVNEPNPLLKRQSFTFRRSDIKALIRQ